MTFRSRATIPLVVPAAAALLLAVAAGRAAEGMAVGTPPPQPGASAPAACGAQAARYEGGRGFGLTVTRAGQTRVENPLRPLTPEITQVLEVVIGSKLATAYGPDLNALRRGGPPSAIGAVLGAPVQWEAALPALPGAIGIVAEDGTDLARLAFRACEEIPPVARAVPQAERKGGGPRKPLAQKDGRAAGKAPPGFSMPQGAIAE